MSTDKPRSPSGSPEPRLGNEPTEVMRPVPPAAPAAAVSPPTAEEPRKRRPAVVALTVGLAILLLAAALVGGYLGGRASRLSSSEVRAKLATQARFDRGRADRRQRVALAHQKRAITERARRDIQRISDLAYNKGARLGRNRGKAEGYASGQATGKAQGQAEGQAQGFNQGQSQGFDQGYSNGFDTGTCFTPGTLEYIC